MIPGEMKFNLKNCQTETAKLCSCVEDLGKTHALTRKTVFAISLALEELFVNIVSYGFKDDLEHLIGVCIHQENGTLVIRIEDDGIPFNPENEMSPDVKCPLEESKIGGLGIHLVKKMMDEITYERRDKKNVIIMKKHLKGN